MRCASEGVLVRYASGVCSCGVLVGCASEVC